MAAAEGASAVLGSALQMAAAAAAAGPQAEQILQANYLIGACFSNLVRIARGRSLGAGKKIKSRRHDNNTHIRRLYNAALVLLRSSVFYEMFARAL